MMANFLFLNKFGHDCFPQTLGMSHWGCVWARNTVVHLISTIIYTFVTDENIGGFCAHNLPQISL